MYLGDYERNELSESLNGYQVSPFIEIVGSPSKCIPHIDTDNRLNYNVKLAELMCGEDWNCSGFNYYTDEEKTCFTHYNYAAKQWQNQVSLTTLWNNLLQVPILAIHDYYDY